MAMINQSNDLKMLLYNSYSTYKPNLTQRYFQPFLFLVLVFFTCLSLLFVLYAVCVCVCVCVCACYSTPFLLDHYQEDLMLCFFQFIFI